MFMTQGIHSPQLFYIDQEYRKNGAIYGHRGEAALEHRIDQIG